MKIQDTEDRLRTRDQWGPVVTGGRRRMVVKIPARLIRVMEARRKQIAREDGIVGNGVSFGRCLSELLRADGCDGDV